MPGPVPGISIGLARRRDVDSRNKSGHDGREGTPRLPGPWCGAPSVASMPVSRHAARERAGHDRQDGRPIGGRAAGACSPRYRRARRARALDATGPLCCRPGPLWPTMVHLWPGLARQIPLSLLLARGAMTLRNARGARDARPRARGARPYPAETRDPAGCAADKSSRARPCLLSSPETLRASGDAVRVRDSCLLLAPKTLRARATRPTSGRSPRSAC